MSSNMQLANVNSSGDTKSICECWRTNLRGAHRIENNGSSIETTRSAFDASGVKAGG
jgi:hypothetical protein